MIKRILGKPNVFWMPKAASTVFSGNELVYANNAGGMIPADATSGDHFGISLRKVVSTDSDYATTGAKVPVDFVNPDDILQASVGTGILTPAMVGNRYDLVASGDAIDVTAQAKKVVTIVAMVSATVALIRVNAMVTSENVATT